MKATENVRNAFAQEAIKFERQSNELARNELADNEAKEIEKKVS